MGYVNSRAQLRASFVQPHTIGSKSPLSVGARALSKHVGRATEGFWGPELKGSEAAKVLLPSFSFPSRISSYPSCCLVYCRI
jgi:hypothetical protein